MSTSEVGQAIANPKVRAALFSLVKRFGESLNLRSSVLKCIAEQGVQVEGWLKGEILGFLTEEKNAERILDFDREARIGIGRRRADLVVWFDADGDRCPVWIELKHYLIGFQKGIFYDAYGYFNDPKRGIKPDIEKLRAIASPYRFMLVLTTASPKSTDWQTAIMHFNNKFHRDIWSMTDPKDYPDSHFLGLIDVGD